MRAILLALAIMVVQAHADGLLPPPPGGD